MDELAPWQKLSISYLWEHFLVPEHRIPIWLIFKLGFSVEDVSHGQVEGHWAREGLRAREALRYFGRLDG